VNAKNELMFRFGEMVDFFVTGIQDGRTDHLSNPSSQIARPTVV